MQTAFVKQHFLENRGKPKKKEMGDRRSSLLNIICGNKICITTAVADGLATNIIFDFSK